MTKSLHAALLEFDQSVGILPKTAKAYGYNYCPLPDMMEIISPLLHKLELVVHQTVDRMDGQWVMATTVTHSTGDSRTSYVPLAVKPAWDKAGREVTGSQEMGAAITYARRYGLSTALNLVSDEDTDCQVKRIGRKELGILISTLNGLPDRETIVLNILNGYDIEALEHLPMGVFDKVLNRVSELKQEHLQLDD